MPDVCLGGGADLLHTGSSIHGAETILVRMVVLPQLWHVIALPDLGRLHATACLADICTHHARLGLSLKAQSEGSPDFLFCCQTACPCLSVCLHM